MESFLSVPPRLVRTFLLITARAGDGVGVMQNADTFTSHNALITLFVRSSNEVHITFAYFAIVFLKLTTFYPHRHRNT